MFPRPPQSYPYFTLDALTPQALQELAGPVLVFEAPVPILVQIPTATHNVPALTQPRPTGPRRVVAPLVRRHSTLAEPFTLGRGSRSDVVLPFETVSRAHAFVAEPAPGEYLIYDNHSRNGVILNGELLPPDQWVPLPDDAMLMFGELEISFLLKDSLIAELRAQSVAPKSVQR